tara:strand:+ start:70407 stop:70532 length:126 start_codon:yes stop_codon:yes gene_type:complete
MTRAALRLRALARIICCPVILKVAWEDAREEAWKEPINSVD